MQQWVGRAAVWALAALAHRWWARAPAGSFRKAWSDGLSHAALGLATSLPVSAHAPAPGRVLAGAFTGALAIDLDHVVAARSLRLRTCMTMPTRPATHSLVAASILTLLALRVDRWFGIGFGLGLASHLVRDLVTGGVPLLHPQRVVELPGQWAVLLSIGLSLGGERLARILLNGASVHEGMVG